MRFCAIEACWPRTRSGRIVATGLQAHPLMPQSARTSITTGRRRGPPWAVGACTEFRDSEVRAGLMMASGLAQARSSVASTSPSISIDPTVIGSTTSCRCVAPALAIAAR
jgi:hypothetical protein